jgi:hypothetical protein
MAEIDSSLGKFMSFNVGDDISFDGSIDKTKEAYYSSYRREHEKNKYFPNDSHITRILVTHPHSHYRVTSIRPPYYCCSKLWESGDEEIPINADDIYIHMNEAIAYDRSWDGTVVNKIYKTLGL